MSRVLYLAGIGRSGTTLIERTVAEANSVTALGEVLHLWERGVLGDDLCACGEKFSACTFWTAVGQRAFGGWSAEQAERMLYLKDRVDRVRRMPEVRTRRSPRLSAQAAEYAEGYARIYEAASALTGDVLIDSSKQPSTAWVLQVANPSHSPPVDLRVAHIVRDPRGSATSWARRTERPEADGALMPTYGIARSAAFWNLHNAAAEALTRRVTSLRMRYEDFVINPAAATRALLALAGVDDDVSRWVSGRKARLGGSHSVAGNPMRFRHGELEIRVDERWRQELSASQQRTVEALTTPLRLRYGYGR